MGGYCVKVCTTQKHDQRDSPKAKVAAKQERELTKV